MPGLYLHIPYCRSKCSYCDFFSLTAPPLPLADYPPLLVRQLELAAGNDPPGSFATVFFGGGTPSLLAPAAVARILAAAGTIGLERDAEITLEANPGTLDAGRLAGYRAAGVNRLSLGLQTFDDAALRRLGRRHDAASARRAFALARRAGFDNLSCDLMFGLPGQTPATLARDLDRLLALGPDHVSCYGLTAEPGTDLAAMRDRGEVTLPGEEGGAELYRQVHETLSAAGFEHYEISNYARPGRRCRHNLATWRREKCLGIGAGAHGFDPRGWGRRLAAPCDLQAYAAEVAAGRDPARLLEDFDRAGAMAETLYLGLRTAEGVGEAEFAARFGQGVAQAFPAATARLAGRLTLSRGRWRLDLAGWLLYDHLIVNFL